MYLDSSRSPSAAPRADADVLFDQWNPDLGPDSLAGPSRVDPGSLAWAMPVRSASEEPGDAPGSPSVRPAASAADLGSDDAPGGRTTKVVAAAPDSPVIFPRLGEAIGGFRLITELGRGAFARVYLAHEAALGNRPVALKVSKAEGE